MIARRGLLALLGGLPFMGMPQRPDQVYDPPLSTISASSQSGIFRKISIGKTVILSPSNDTTGKLDTSNIQGQLNNGFNVQLATGIFYINATITVPTGQYLTGSGIGTATIKSLVTTAVPAISMSAPGPAPPNTGGGVSGLIIDGTSAAVGASGVQAGDILNLRLTDLLVENFTTVGGIGYHFINQTTFTENGYFRINTSNCTQHIVFDVGSPGTTSTGSFDSTWLQAEMDIKGGQDGIVLANGANLYHSSLSCHFNTHTTVAANTSAVLRITGTIPAGHPGAGNGSTLHDSHVELLGECVQGVGTNGPFTIFFGALGTNQLINCEGILDFQDGSGTYQPTNWTAASGTPFLFEGIIGGDSVLNPGGSKNMPITLASKAYSGPGAINDAGGGIFQLFCSLADFFSMVLTRNTTIQLHSTFGGALGAVPQRKTVLIQQAAAGGPFTVTWPHNATPTTSSPSVVWAGGTPPVMSAGASAVDLYKLETVDGATWVGQAIQNVS